LGREKVYRGKEYDGGLEERRYHRAIGSASVKEKTRPSKGGSGRSLKLGGNCKRKGRSGGGC